MTTKRYYVNDSGFFDAQGLPTWSVYDTGQPGRVNTCDGYFMGFEQAQRHADSLNGRVIHRG